jgi:predicted glycoside hydrolase/deacetylase ChbG (UPF0249 family)
MPPLGSWIALAFQCAPTPAREPAANLAERLGYGADARLLIVHADDVGMCHGVNVATRDAMQQGIVSSGSIMVPCPWFPEIAAHCRENPDADFGIHLTLTSEWQHYRWGPVLPRTEVPGLVDEEGYLWQDARSAATHASADEVEAECRAQIERAREFGVRPTHIDTHMGVLYARPDFFAAYYRLAVEYAIPAMIPRPTPETIERFRREGYELPDATIRLAQSQRVPTLDELATGVPSGPLQPRKEEYHGIIRHLRPGATQIIVHLGLDTAEMRAIMGSWEARLNDYRIFTDDDTRALLRRENVRLIGWRDIQRLMASE